MQAAAENRQISISEISVSGYRAFSEQVKVRISPITLLIGAGNSGKSGVIQLIADLGSALTSGHHPRPTLNPGILAWKKNSNADDPVRFRVKGNVKDQQEFLQEHPEEPAASVTAFTLEGQAVSQDEGEAQLTLANGESGAVLTQVWALARGDMPEDETDWADWDETTLAETMAEAALGEDARRLLQSVKRLGPHRTDYDGNLIMGDVMGSVGKCGERTLHHLQKMFRKGNGEELAFLERSLAPMTGLAGISFQDHSENISTASALTEGRREKYPLGEAGTGALQSLPMLVQGILMKPGGTLAVEHPENGLHPRNQLELGSFFADLWLRRGVRSIIETHSDNLILRLRRLATSGQLPNRDISIAYFHQNPDTGSIQVRNIRVEEDGSLEPGLPMSFFGADVVEGLNMGARIPDTG